MLVDLIEYTTTFEWLSVEKHTHKMEKLQQDSSWFLSSTKLKMVNLIAQESSRTTVLKRAEKGNGTGMKQTLWQSHCECERDGGVRK